MSITLRFEVVKATELDRRECFWCKWPESHHQASDLSCTKTDGFSTIIQLTRYKPVDKNTGG